MDWIFKTKAIKFCVNVVLDMLFKIIGSWIEWSFYWNFHEFFSPLTIIIKTHVCNFSSIIVKHNPHIHAYIWMDVCIHVCICLCSWLWMYMCILWINNCILTNLNTNLIHSNVNGLGDALPPSFLVALIFASSFRDWREWRYRRDDSSRFASFAWIFS